jgi:hypothetical protein
VRQEIITTRIKQVKEGLDPLKGHGLLTRLKVATALAFLHRELNITDQWWEIAGLIMAWSEQEQERCQVVLNTTTVRAAEARGRSEGLSEFARNETVAESSVRRIREKLIEVLRVEPITWNDAVHKIGHNLRKYFPAAVSSLADEGRVVVEDYTYKGRKARRLKLMG